MSDSGVKRAHEDGDVDAAAGEPTSKKARTTTTPDLGLDRVWWFVTCGEDGASYWIIEWDPQSAANPTEAATALLAAYTNAKSRIYGAKGDRLYDDIRYFADLIDWLVEVNSGAPLPEAIGGTHMPEREKMGAFKRVRDGGDMFEAHDGRTLFYHSWC